MKTHTHTETHIHIRTTTTAPDETAGLMRKRLNLMGAIEERLLSSFLNPNPTPLVHTSVIPDDEMSGSVQK